jgi:VanZ family protein
MKISSERRRVFRTLWLAALVLVVVGSLLPDSATPAVLHRLNDKLLHAAAYLVLGLIPALHEKWSSALLQGGAAIGVGVLMECGQLLSPGRSCDPRDMVADAVGVLVGLGLGRMWQILAAG